MSAVDPQRFAVGQGRSRPAYDAKGVQCANCGAGLKVKDERSELVVCPYCSAHLELSRTELRVLGIGAKTDVGFQLEIGDSFRHQGARYEVVARLAFIEDGDPTEMTRQYFLYNPYAGPLWLSEYKGVFDLSTASHVMPQGDPFALSKGQTLATYDGRAWICADQGEYELHYVDGALPWIARAGDRVRYAEFVDQASSGERYEATAYQNEREYARGWTLSASQVEQATGKSLGGGMQAAPPVAGPSDFDPSSKKAAMRGSTWLMIAAAVVAVALVFHFIAGMVVKDSGNRVTRWKVPASSLTGESLSEPFGVSGGGNNIRIELLAYDLDNAWMAVDAALVKDEDKVLHVFDRDISYYHGVEGGESWSEGANYETAYVKMPEQGTYRMLLHGVSARGNVETASQALHDLTVEVYDGVYVPSFFRYGLFVGGAMLFALIWGIAAVRKKEQSGFQMGSGFERGAGIAAIAVAVLGTGTTTFATVAGYGADELEHPGGVSLRQSSVSSGGGSSGFFVGYATRSHLGGGLAGGK